MCVCVVVVGWVGVWSGIGVMARARPRARAWARVWARTMVRIRDWGSSKGHGQGLAQC